MEDMDIEQAVRKPRFVTVVVFTAAFAIIISWVACYAIPNALVAADVIQGWPSESDPRRLWMLQSFGGLFGTFTVTGLLLHWMSHRSLKRIDAMADAEG